MIFAVEFAQAARDDLIGILDFIAADNPDRAESFVNEIKASVHKRLEAFPYSGNSVGSYRYIVFRGDVAVYAIDEDGKRVLVVLVAEGHRDWRSAFE